MQTLSYNIQMDGWSECPPGLAPLQFAPPHAYSLPLSYQLPYHQTALSASFGPSPANKARENRHDANWQRAGQLHPWAGSAPYGYWSSSHVPSPCWQPAPPPLPQNLNPGKRFIPSTEIKPISLPSNSRGPPSKPKHSDWAVWAGNLPPHTSVVHLKDHFATGARNDIESVFLITKTGCAFVNYSSETACHGAIQRFDQQQFRGNRLVCRIRRNASNGNAGSISTSPSTSDVTSLEFSSSRSSTSEGLSGRHRTPEVLQSEPALELDSSSEASACKDSLGRSDTPLIVQSDQHTKRSNSVPDEPVTPLLNDLDRLHISPKVKARFFILKSLTLQDLLVSSRDGDWTTQPHNEDKLNAAFSNSEDVYLIFSVNKSGEYFGYGRMESPITEVTRSPTSDDTSGEKGPGPTETRGQAGDSPSVIPTPATQTAPEGRIIDDSARGTIFWEAKSSAILNGEENDATNDDHKGAGTCRKHFAIRWMSTNRVPFHATRGLRNPLNHNREIKIARDGTEVDSHVAWRLLDLFNRRPDFERRNGVHYAKS